MSIELKLLGKTSRVLRAWVCSITLCLGVSACISPDLEPPRGSGTTLPAAPNAPQQNGAKPSDGLIVGGTGGSAATAGPGNTGTTTPPKTMTPPAAAAGRGATTPGGANPQTPGMTTPTAGAAGAASEANDNDADAGVP